MFYVTRVYTFPRGERAMLFRYYWGFTQLRLVTKETLQNFYTCTTFSHYSNILSKYVFTIDFNFFVHFREPHRHRNRRAIECYLAEAKAGIVRRKEKNTNKRATETHYCANQEGHVRNLPVDCRSLTPLCLGGLERQQQRIYTSVTQYTHLIRPAAVQDGPRKIRGVSCREPVAGHLKCRRLID